MQLYLIPVSQIGPREKLHRRHNEIDGLVQNCSNSSTLAMDLLH